ncbi:MAG TPA: hypothetical protein VF498_06120 [Anaerolineales bacterium]
MAYLQHKNWLFKLASRTISQASSLHSAVGPSPKRRPLIPATLKRMSSLPNSWRAAATMAATSPDWVSSAGKAWAWTPNS